MSKWYCIILEYMKQNKVFYVFLKDGNQIRINPNGKIFNVGTTKDYVVIEQVYPYERREYYHFNYDCIKSVEEK